MNKCPCKDCIVLAICRAKLLNVLNQYFMTSFGAINFLKKDCSLLHEYVKKSGNGLTWTNFIKDIIEIILCP